MLETNRWVPGYWLSLDPLFENLKGEERLKKYMEAFNKRIELHTKNYEELKDLPLSQLIPNYPSLWSWCCRKALTGIKL